MQRFLLIGLIPLMLSACSNPYSEFYKQVNQIPQDMMITTSADPQVVWSSNIDSEIQKAFNAGFSVLGEANFNSGHDEHDDAAIKKQARLIGSTLVFVGSKYTGTNTGAMPLTLPKTTTSFTTSNAYVNTPYGSATGYGNATTTTYGTETTMIPYSVDRRDYAAIFMVKTKYKFGAMVDRVPDDIKREMGTNAGAMITRVRDNSPALAADLIVGDVILAMNGEKVNSAADFSNRITGSTGPVKFTVFRNGKTLSLDATVPSGYLDN